MGMAKKHICIEEIRGCEGNCITINDYRVAGPKPWGSGIVVKNWVADVDNVIRALRDNDVVKVVRCKDCKHYCSFYNECSEPHNHYTEEGFREVYDEDFCSYGERRDNGSAQV